MGDPIPLKRSLTATLTSLSPSEQDEKCPRCGGWEHPVWIERFKMCQACYEKRDRLKALFAASGLNARAKERTFARMDRSKAHPAGLKAVEAWAYGARGLFLYGDNGVGKTYLAQCLAMRELVKHNRRLRWWNVPRLLLDIKGGFKKAVTEDLIDQARTIPLLFLDDLGAEKATEWARETLFVIVDDRLEGRLPMIITSNLYLDGLETSLGRRIADRIPEACEMVKMEGKSLRLGT